MFALAIAVQIPRLNVSMNGKVAVLLLWSAYGIIPLGHWAVAMGGLENELVRVCTIGSEEDNTKLQLGKYLYISRTSLYQKINLIRWNTFH